MTDEQRTIKLTLPYPPSTNRYWRTDRHGKPHLSDDAKVYRTQANVLARQAMTGGVLRGPLAVTIRLYRPQKSGDLDNFIKQPLDALQGVVYDNDSQIVRLYVERFDAPSAARCEIDIQEVGPVTLSLFGE